MEALSCGVLLQDVRPPSVTPTCARLPRSFVILLRSVIERVVTAVAVICVRVGQIAPCRRGPVGSTVRLQPDHGHDTASPSASSSHAVSDRVIGPKALPLPASASFAQPARRGWRALVDNRGGRRHCIQDSPPISASSNSCCRCRSSSMSARSSALLARASSEVRFVAA
jgi:hypothetical protein